MGVWATGGEEEKEREAEREEEEERTQWEAETKGDGRKQNNNINFQSLDWILPTLLPTDLMTFSVEFAYEVQTDGLDPLLLHLCQLKLFHNCLKSLYNSEYNKILLY